MLPVHRRDWRAPRGSTDSGYRVTTNHGPDSRQSVFHLHWHVMGGAPLSESDVSAVGPTERAQRVIELDDRVAVELAGEHDRVLRELEDRLDLEIALRGNRLTLSGDEDARARRPPRSSSSSPSWSRAGRPIEPGTVEAVADAVEGAERGRPMLDDVVWRHRADASSRRARPARSATWTRSATTRSPSASARPAPARPTSPWRSPPPR